MATLYSSRSTSAGVLPVASPSPVSFNTTSVPYGGLSGKSPSSIVGAKKCRGTASLTLSFDCAGLAFNVQGASVFGGAFRSMHTKCNYETMDYPGVSSSCPIPELAVSEGPANPQYRRPEIWKWMFNIPSSARKETGVSYSMPVSRLGMQDFSLYLPGELVGCERLREVVLNNPGCHKPLSKGGTPEPSIGQVALITHLCALIRDIQRRLWFNIPDVRIHNSDRSYLSAFTGACPPLTLSDSNGLVLR
ncbi:hypothetical protein K474DRAFT_1673064 [Panus rudis PR-1116 ss-1]|nr:hypothetical protein K474DRAFT_1673064 [Panus rudis PR-1116 ss-1]